MARLEVEPKPARPWWVWALIVIILIALAGMLLRKCDAEYSDAHRATATDSVSTPIATTVPDWNTVDLNSATSTDLDI